jgi:glycerol-3-phosphate dehydrogenase
VWPAQFVMPHVPQLRPRWMIRTGLFLYDHLARRSLLPASRSIRLDALPYASGLKTELRHGFVYSDCRVDDARLVICNALDAARRGARVLVRTACVSAERRAGMWLAALSNGERVEARALVNAAGPWVKEVLGERLRRDTGDNVRLVRGSHIVLPRLYEGEHAFILQNDDRRVVFMIPYEERFTLVGTTDVTEESPQSPKASSEEVEYLCRAANRYLAKPVSPAQVAWRFAGIRPLHDDGSADPSSVTRDYTLKVDDEAGQAPVLSVFGGKITTYRRLAEHAMEKIAPYFPALGAPWTGTAALPGSDFDDREAARHEMFQRYRKLPAEIVRSVFRRHGSLAAEVLGDGETGEHYGAGLCEREVRYFKAREWAREADDVLWRRTKAGLHLDARQQANVAEALAR